MSILELAIQIAHQAHAGQTDKAGAPYITHPLRVMARVEGEIAKIVAVLHDVVEDSPEWSFARLRAVGIPDEALSILELVTKRPEEKDDYDAFIARAATHPVARRVKIADLEDNLDLRRLPNLTDRDVERLRKYHHAWRLLCEQDRPGADPRSARRAEQTP